MELRDVIYQGPEIDSQSLLGSLPDDYRDLLQQLNGFVQFFGGLHVRGVCSEPLWHSLHAVWHGEFALSQLYSSIEPSDIPFGQDAVGDQFILRDLVVHRLLAETGELATYDCDLLTFLERAQEDPVAYLSLQPMLQFYEDGGQLQPGELISVYPPFCTKEAAEGVSLRAIPALERLGFLATFARQIVSLKDGQQISIQTPQPPNEPS
jgi:hypothetical protein